MYYVRYYLCQEKNKLCWKKELNCLSLSYANLNIKFYFFKFFFKVVKKVGLFYLDRGTSLLAILNIELFVVKWWCYTSLRNQVVFVLGLYSVKLNINMYLHHQKCIFLFEFEIMNSYVKSNLNFVVIFSFVCLLCQFWQN